jgi:glycosyltransferase involved in cell wall biosynthesis
MASWSICIMCFNERATLADVVTSALAVGKKSGGDYEVVIVDDGSSDGSRELSDELAATLPHVRVVHHPVNRGIGEVLRTAYREARMDWVTCVPADTEFVLADLLDGMPLMQDGVAVAYRISTFPGWHRRVVSNLQRLLNVLLFGLRVERVNWVKILPARVVASLPLVSTSPVVETEVMVRLQRLGYRFVEPLSHNELRLGREGGMSKLMFLRSIVRSIGDTFRLAAALAAERRAS